jgi:hypothetical protein
MRSRANPSKFTDRRQRLFTRGLAALIVALGLLLVPTPYYLIAPGKAVDLATRVSVEGRPPPARRFYLTDVTVAPASVLLLAAGLWPGVRIVRRDSLVPPGESARGYDRAMVDAMGESQIAAAIVAERAAGYRVPEPPRQVVAVDFLPASRAQGILADGDGLTRVNGTAIRDVGDIAAALRGVAPGTSVAVSFVRSGRPDAPAAASCSPSKSMRASAPATPATPWPAPEPSRPTAASAQSKAPAKNSSPPNAPVPPPSSSPAITTPTSPPPTTRKSASSPWQPSPKPSPP